MKVEWRDRPILDQSDVRRSIHAATEHTRMFVVTLTIPIGPKRTVFYEDHSLGGLSMLPLLGLVTS